MKKTLLYSMLVTGAFLFGCSSAPQTTNPSTTQTETPITSQNPNSTNISGAQVTITEEQAKEIALKEVGSGNVIEFSYDMDDIIPNYDITIVNGTTEYEFEISAVDGSILKRSSEQNPLITTEVKIDEAKVKEIINNQVNGTIVGIKLDRDDYLPVYDVTVVDGTYKYEFEVSAMDGSILSKDQELINQASNINTNQGLNIDQTKAKEIALGQVNSGVIGEFSLDYERGIPVYEITVYEGRTEYEFEISGIDGSIISRSVDTNLD